MMMTTAPNASAAATPSGLDRKRMEGFKTETKLLKNCSNQFKTALVGQESTQNGTKLEVVIRLMK